MIEWTCPQDRCVLPLKDSILRWLGTPYGRGSIPGMSSDCVQLPAAVLDMVYYNKIGVTAVPTLPLNSAIAGVGSWTQIVLAYRKGWGQFGGSIRVRDNTVFPGDIIVCPFWSRSVNGGAGHLMIASWNPMEFFHSTSNLGAHITKFDSSRPTIARYRVKEGWS